MDVVWLHLVALLGAFGLVMLTQERLKELLEYDPETGVFVWLQTTSNRVKVGSVAGCRRRDGYLLIRLDGKLYLGHRLAWLYVHGEWPANVIDHIDQNKSNNAISNLRDTSMAVNGLNKDKPRRHNTTGFMGVSKRKDRFLAQVSRKRGLTKLFDTPEEAHEWYLATKATLLEELL